MKTEDKTTVKNSKNDFVLHVALIQRDGLSKPDAIVLAYAEGKAGLQVRLTGVVK